ncbi:unnamed protein product [Periconia digitata]|uniref:Uncharacterized protein n=1 Tax=Periconia digitata TaxID=1303443 RepID=A0A9W4XU99_9PLEO|nr:unnamed protein product [Periconia digitata]
MPPPAPIPRSSHIDHLPRFERIKTRKPTLSQTPTADSNMQIKYLITLALGVLMLFGLNLTGGLLLHLSNFTVSIQPGPAIAIRFSGDVKLIWIPRNNGNDQQRNGEPEGH